MAQRAGDNHNKQRHAPRDAVVVQLKHLTIAFALHNHLVKVERNNARPSEVAQKEEVHANRQRNAETGVAKLYRRRKNPAHKQGEETNQSLQLYSTK